MGPNALWVESPGFAGFLPPGQPVIFQGNVLRCGDMEIDCANVFNWRGESGAEAGDDLKFANRALQEVRSWLEIQAPGLTSSLTPGPGSGPAFGAASSPVPGPIFSSGAGGGLVREIVRGLLAGDELLLQTALWRLVGAGEGLTPSGDDFVAGVLLAYVRGHRWIRHRVDHRVDCRASTGDSFISRLPGLVEDLLPGTNAVSQTMLWYAARGEGAAYLAETADAIYAGSPTAVNCAYRLWRIGASSGRYLLAGVILGSGVFLTGVRMINTGVQNKSGSGTNGREDCGQAQYVF